MASPQPLNLTLTLTLTTAAGSSPPLSSLPITAAQLTAVAAVGWPGLKPDLHYLTSSL